MRLLITGIPGSGKTTLARALISTLPGAWSCVHTDNFKHLPWPDQPAAVLDALRAAEQITPHVLLEGVGAVRLLTAGTEGDRDVWLPNRVLCCLRADGLLSPKHKGIAGLIDSRLGAYQGTITYIRDSRIAVESLETAMALVGELQYTP